MKREKSWRRWCARWRGGGSDEGRVMLLSLGFVVVALLLIAGVTSVAAVHLERKRLYALTDLVALDAADSVTPKAYRAAQVAIGDDAQVVGLPLTDEGVYAAVEDYLARHPEAVGATWVSLQIVDASSSDGQSATVELEAVATPGPVGWVFTFWGDGVTLHAQSRAHAS